jgi:transcriptional regulator with XRE-family HTH domain
LLREVGYLLVGPSMIRFVPQNRLRSLRKERGLTLEQVSQGCLFQSCTPPKQKDRDVTLGTAFRLAHGFNTLPLLATLIRPFFSSASIVPRLAVARTSVYLALVRQHSLQKLKLLCLKLLELRSFGIREWRLCA